MSEPQTIVAAATPPGHGALGVVRLSGPSVVSLLARYCRPLKVATIDALSYYSAHPRRALRFEFVTDDGQILDDGLLTYFPGPASYTGEDCAELTLHGNPHLLRRVVLTFLESELVRPAEGGEFTRRAFLNGKLDLTQAEAVRRVIEARSEYEARAGRRLLGGALSKLVSRLRSELVGLKAEVEAEVDFSTEDLTFQTRAEREERARGLLERISEILERSNAAGRVAQGLQLSLAGVPNAGKSSLLNQILGWERAIVSEVPGTTRDAVSEELHIGGTVLRIVDTAGLRDTQDSVEREGVRRSKQEIERSQIVLWVIDGSRQTYPEIESMLGRAGVIAVLNKIDQLHPEAWSGEGLAQGQVMVRVSCKTGAGMTELRQAIAAAAGAAIPTGEALLLEDRHRFHLERVAAALQRLLDLWKGGAPQEIAALEVDQALEEIGQLVGRVTNEEVLGRIFSVFCVGK